MMGNAIVVQGANKRYSDFVALDNVDFEVPAGSLTALLGPSGSGKSTLLRAIAGELPLLEGQRLGAQGLRIGYFAQHQLEQLRQEESALWHLRRLEPATREQELRDFLGGFDFRGDRVGAPVAEFSGGEKARLTLALLVRQRPNLMLLDEPTNHLDIEMREALTEALQDYEGALIVVAHDRHLLRATADELWLVVEGGLKPFNGDLDDYRDWVRARRARDESDGAAKPRNGSSPDRRARKRAAAEERQRLSDLRRPLQNKIADVEAEMEALDAEKRDHESWLASADAYDESNKEQLISVLERQGDLTWQLARAEEQWLELQARLEEIG